MTPARAGTSAVAAVLGVAGLLLVLVTWAASIGPDDVLRGEGLRPERSPESTTATTLSTLPPQRKPEDIVRDAAEAAPLWLRIVALVVQLLMVGVALYFIWQGLRRIKERWDHRSPRRPRPTKVAEVEFEVVDASAEMAGAIEEDAAAQRALLEQGEPRNAIVACWHRFEEQARRVNVVRRPWETPAEFALGVLDLAGADASAVGRLADLYREARFSDHPLTAQHRVQALAALDAIHASLSQAARTDSAAPR